MNIAIFLGGSFGDILNATPVVKELKNHDHNITWFISEEYKYALDNNKFIDSIKTYKSNNKNEHIMNGFALFKEYSSKNIFDKCVILSPSVLPEWNSGNNNISQSICLAANRQLNITLDATKKWIPHLNLSPEEISHVQDSLKSINNKFILFECCPESGQSNIDIDLIKKMSILSYNNNYTPVISCKPSVRNKFIKQAIIPKLTVREMVHLYRYAKLFISCSSGLSVAASSDHNKDLDKHPIWIEFITNPNFSTKLMGPHNINKQIFPHASKTKIFSKFADIIKKL